ncbi:MAG: hypothetical protein LCH54_13655 [Bacteroidetes bacterium]|nr:hypothetical protein [Bacteroidota bacterium]
MEKFFGTSAFLGFKVQFWFIISNYLCSAPVGLGLMDYGKFLLWLFGKAMVSVADRNVDQNKAWKIYSTIAIVIYLPFGLLFAIGAVFQVSLLFNNLIGIPVALVVAKSLGTYLNPVNKKCVHEAV